MEKEFFGEGSIQSLEGILKHYSAQRVFLVTGKKSYELSGAREKIENLLEGRNFYRHFEFEENPKYTDLLQGAREVRAYKPDIIVSVGGGSVMDTAKILSVLPTDNANAIKVIKGDIATKEKIAPIVAIPTTSGSGSEATHFAVAYKGKRKFSVSHQRLLPNYVILDPELTYSMPSKLTAVTAFDALCQAIESYWAVGSTSKSRKYSTESIQLILEVYERIIEKPDKESRRIMVKASHLAGQAINISKTTGPHAASYSLTANYSVPHGHAVILLLPGFFIFNGLAGVKKIHPNITYKSHQKRMDELYKLLKVKGPFEAAQYIREIISFSALESKLAEIGINDIELIAQSVNEKRLLNNPVKVNTVDLVNIINKCI